MSLTGKKVNGWTFLEINPNDKERWLCECECGNLKYVQSRSILNNRSKCCGCRGYKYYAEDVTGKRFSRLTAICPVRGKKEWLWECSCDCGATTYVRLRNLKNGNTKSCGCLSVDESTERIKIYNKQHEGERPHNYNPNMTNEERELGRNIDGYREWCFNVKKLARFTCDCCGDSKGGNLVSHHLNGYHWCKDGRTDISNGVCLCETCHKAFHKEYGNRNNTKEQYIEFKQNKIVVDK